MTPNPGSIMHALLETFAFLSLTKREAYEPKQLVEVSRPSWFNPGSQQVCFKCYNLIMMLLRLFYIL